MLSALLLESCVSAAENSDEAQPCSQRGRRVCLWFLVRSFFCLRVSLFSFSQHPPPPTRQPHVPSWGSTCIYARVYLDLHRA